MLLLHQLAAWNLIAGFPWVCRTTAKVDYIAPIEKYVESRNISDYEQFQKKCGDTALFLISTQWFQNSNAICSLFLSEKDHSARVAW
jgi:hypothetical protein